MSSSGWQQLLSITDGELKKANEETLDKLYAFLLTNRITDGPISDQPNDLKKILGTVQTILELKDVEVQELLTAYDNQPENQQLKQLVTEQKARIHQLEENGCVVRGSGREVTLLREEVDELRMKMDVAERQLERQKIEKENLSKELSFESHERRKLKEEVDSRREEVEGYRNKLTAHQLTGGRVGGVVGLVEKELRERLKMQEREMAEQLDKMEELLADRQGLDQRLADVTEELDLVTEENRAKNETLSKHQEVLDKADESNRALQAECHRMASQIEHTRDQLSEQENANSQLTEMIQAEREKYKTEIASKSNLVDQYKEKLSQVEGQLKMLLQDTNKSQMLKLSKEVSDKRVESEQLQTRLAEMSEDIDHLTTELEKAKRFSDPAYAHQALSQEVNSLRLKLKENENLLQMERERRERMEGEKEEWDEELMEVRRRLEQYESGEVGLREAVMEIKQRKNEIAQRDSEIAQLIQQANQLQTDSDTLYDENEAMRDRLGMGPEDIVQGIEEVRSRKEKAMQSLRAENQSLIDNIQQLEEEKMTLRKKLVDKSLLSRPPSITPTHSPGSIKNTPINLMATPTHSSPDHMTLADLNGQLSHLQSLLATERKRKEACQREITRLSRQLAVRGEEKGTKKTNVDTRRGRSLGSSRSLVEEVDYESDELLMLREENQMLRNQLESHSISKREAGQLAMEAPLGPRNTGPREFDHKGSGNVLSTAAGHTHNDQLLLVLRELKEREACLSHTKEQLDQYKRKFSVIIHQQGVLYKEYHEAKGKWVGQREAWQQKVEEVVTEREQNVIRKEELERLQSSLSNNSDPNNKTLGEMSRRITKLRVNERVLFRRCSYLETSQTSLRKEVSVLKQSLDDVQLSCSQQLAYIQRYKDAASFKISSLSKQLTESVPLLELEEIKAQLSSVCGQYQALLTAQVAVATGQTEERIRELSLALNESKVRERQILERVTNESVDPRRCQQLEGTVSILERDVARLTQDNSLVKQRADMLQHQLEYVQDRNEERERELESLRYQHVELSTASDQKATVGQLQQQILTMKQSEASSLRQLRQSQAKVKELQVQLLHSHQQNDDSRDNVDKITSQYTMRIRKLNSSLLCNQRLYCGATLLPDQVKLHTLLTSVHRDKKLATDKLTAIEDERIKMEDTHTQLLVQQRNLQELIDTLKAGNNGSFVSKVTEWHSKLGEMRLKGVQQQRVINRLEERVAHLVSQLTSREQDVISLEQRLVQADKNFEELSFCWEDESKGYKTTRTSSPKPTPLFVKVNQVHEEMPLKNDKELHFNETVSRLQSDITSYKSRIHQLETTLAKAEEHSLHHRKLLTESAEQLNSKDRTVFELEHRLGVLEERVVTEGRVKETVSRNTIQLATDTVEQIQAQLAHKEDQLERYQQLLQDTKREHLVTTETLRQETDRLRGQLDLTNQKLAKETRASLQRLSTPVHHQRETEGEQYERIKELQDLVKQLEESNEILQSQFEQRAATWEGERRELRARDEERKKDGNKMKMKYNLHIKELQGTLTAKNERVQDLEDELELVKSELVTLMESSSRSPSKTLHGLVEKLRLQLTEKEQQLEALRRALQQVRTDLMETTQKTIQSHSRQEHLQFNVQKMLNDRAREVEREFEGRLDQLQDQLNTQEQILANKEKEARSSQQEHKRLHDKLSKIEKDMKDRNVELEESENSLKEVRNQLSDIQEREEKLKKESKQQTMTHNREKGELRERCMQLQSRVDQQSKHIKRLQEDKDEKLTSSLIKTKHSALEIVRWEEGKKWQKKLDSVKGKLSARNKELEECQGQVASLRDIIKRTEREKCLVQEKLRSIKRDDRVSAASPSIPIVASTIASVDDTFELRSQIYQQNNEILDLKKQLRKQTTDKIQQLQTENQLLIQSNTALQTELKGYDHTVQTSEGGSLLLHETRLRQDLLQSKKQLTQLQFKHEQAMIDIPRLKARVDELQQYIKSSKCSPTATESGSKGQGGVTDVKPGTYTAGEVEKVVSAMKKVIERLQRENDSLKKHNRQQPRADIETENRKLKEELDKTRQTLASLGGAGGKDTPLMTVISENDRLRAELRKEVERVERHVVEISRIKMEKAKIEQRLSEPQGALIRDREQLAEENAKLRSELEGFDQQFFEEIEDLKYNYQEAVRKNVEYEDHIQLLNSQYGLTSSS